MKQIDQLPNDVLLEIFVIVNSSFDYSLSVEKNIEKWQPLVHVCRRWRSLVLGSPRSLNLQLLCTPKTPAKDILDIWPPLPLIVRGRNMTSTDNVIAALEQSNRVCQVFLWNIAGRQLEQVLAAMQVPFPELTDLELVAYGKTPAIPDSFL